MRRRGHPRPCRRLLRDGHGSRMRGINEFVDPLQKSHGIAIVIAAIDVWQPFAGLARIIEVEHRGDGIDAKPIHMIAVEPEQRIGREKRRDLAAAEIVNRGVPVRMETKARIGMFVKRLAVELRKAMNVGWEMRRNPVEDHAETRRMRSGQQSARSRPDRRSAGSARKARSAHSPRRHRADAPRSAAVRYG